MQFKESEIPLTIGIQNPCCTDLDSLAWGDVCFEHSRKGQFIFIELN